MVAAIADTQHLQYLISSTALIVTPVVIAARSDKGQTTFLGIGGLRRGVVSHSQQTLRPMIVALEYSFEISTHAKRRVLRFESLPYVCIGSKVITIIDVTQIAVHSHSAPSDGWS